MACEHLPANHSHMLGLYLTAHGLQKAAPRIGIGGTQGTSPRDEHLAVPGERVEQAQHGGPTRNARRLVARPTAAAAQQRVRERMDL